MMTKESEELLSRVRKSQGEKINKHHPQTAIVHGLLFGLLTYTTASVSGWCRPFSHSIPEADGQRAGTMCQGIGDGVMVIDRTYFPSESQNTTLEEDLTIVRGYIGDDETEFNGNYAQVSAQKSGTIFVSAHLHWAPLPELSLYVDSGSLTSDMISPFSK